MTTTKEDDIDELHTELSDSLKDGIDQCFLAGKRLRLSPGESAGIVIAALTHELTKLMVQTGTPEHMFLNWCHEHYHAVQEWRRGKSN